MSAWQILAMKLDDAAAHLEALGNPTRLKIYRMLVRAGEAGMPVGRLQAAGREELSHTEKNYTNMIRNHDIFSLRFLYLFDVSA